MSKRILQLKVGTRNSPLAVTQARDALDRWSTAVPFVSFDLLEYSSPGDRDQKGDLQTAAENFFTQDLDEAVLTGAVDCAMHSAKDMPYPSAEGIDWFWLPWSEDRRDVLVVRKGESVADLREGGRIGVSSDRREAFARARFPGFQLGAVRGPIGARLDQLDAGDFDILIIAGAALLRLGLTERIAEWIPLSELEPPASQGTLGVSFRAGDERMERLRNQFMHAAYLVGAGPGDPGLCTIAAQDAIRDCDVCLHDALVSDRLLESLPTHVEIINVGKRSGAHYMAQEEICSLMLNMIRQGNRVVRLKGGDPGIFGRLSEEIESLESGRFGYQVVPGVSSLNAATTGTGLLMTRRGVSRGMTMMTPRSAGGASQPVGLEDRNCLPLAFFMSVSRAADIADQLMGDGRNAEESCAVVFDAGMTSEAYVFGTLSTIGTELARVQWEGAGLFLVGDAVNRDYLYDRGAAPLEGKRIILACSQALQRRAAAAVRDRGGIPVLLPMIRVEAEPASRDVIARIADYDWVVVTSPSAVRVLFEHLDYLGVDLRCLPKIMVCGSGTAESLSTYQLRADAVPDENFGREGVVACSREVIDSGARVLRVRSDQAGELLTEELREQAGLSVDDCVIYRTVALSYDQRPTADVVFFGSGSSVTSYIDNFGVAGLGGLHVLAIGRPTLKILTDYGVSGCIVPDEATVRDAMDALGLHLLRRALDKMTTDLREEA